MIRRFLACLVTATWLLGAQSSVAAPAVDAAAVHAAVTRYLDASNLPGALVVVTDGGRTVVAEGFGVDGRGRKLTAASRAPICSVSKSFVALAVMQLVDEGRVKLDAPVISYLPDFSLADPRGSTITVRQLLSHRSGLSDRAFREKSVRPTPRNLTEGVAALRQASLTSEPGTQRSYTNPNYWLAAHLVEVVSGQSFDQYMRHQVFTPLGMTSTSTWNVVTEAPAVGPGHIRILEHFFAAPEPAWFLGGACGVVTTAEDMGRWLAMQNTGRSESGVAIVSPGALAAMHAGLGWNAYEDNGHRIVSHNGVMFTYSADQVLLPDIGEGVGVAVIASAGVGLGPLPADDLAHVLVDVAEGGAGRPPPPVGLIIDVVLGLAAMTAVGMSARQWMIARKARPVWRRCVGGLIALLPLVWLTFYPAVLRGALGRDLNWPQSLYATPMLFVLVTALAAAGLSSMLLSLVRGGPPTTVETHSPLEK